MNDLNPQVQYHFRSAKGTTVIITSRLGESAARTAAMEYFGFKPGQTLGKFMAEVKALDNDDRA